MIYSFILSSLLFERDLGPLSAPSLSNHHLHFAIIRVGTGVMEMRGCVSGAPRTKRNPI